MSNKIVFIGVVSLFFLTLFSCGNRMQEAEALYKEGFIASKNPDSLNEATDMLLQSLALQDESKPTELLVKTYERISRMYWMLDYNEKSLDYAKKAVAAMKDIDNDSLRLGAYNRVASCYYITDLPLKFDSAAYYWNKMLELAIAKKDNKNIMDAYNNLGAILVRQEKYDEALAMFERSFSVPAQKQADRAKYYYNRSRCFEFKEQWDSCIAAIRKSLPMHDPNDYEAIAKLYIRWFYAEKHLNHHKDACIYADSAITYMGQYLEEHEREDLKSVTERHQRERYSNDLRLQRTHWLVVVLGMIVIFGLLFLLMTFRNKRRMESLQRRMEALNLRVVREEQVKKHASAHKEESGADLPSPSTGEGQGEEVEWTEEKEENLSMLYLEQFKVLKEIFLARPAYPKLRQLRYHTDKNYLPDEERLPLIDSILEVFIDPLQKLVATYPELTEDECIYALLIFVGCNNATASIITKTSEVTLRKRRSRFKQKTSEQVFNLFMGVK